MADQNLDAKRSCGRKEVFDLYRRAHKILQEILCISIGDFFVFISKSWKD